MTEREAMTTAMGQRGGIRSRARAAVDLLLDCCPGVPHADLSDRPGALSELARNIAEAIVECEHRGSRSVPPASEIARHPDFPVILARRVLGGLHLHAALETSADAGVLAGLVARRLLLDGDVRDARDLAVLALDLASRSEVPYGELILGVLAAALSGCGNGEQAEEIRDVLRGQGHDVESWRDIEAWAAAVHPRDDVEADPWGAGPAVSIERQVGLLPASCSTTTPVAWAEPAWIDAMERFGLHRHRRLHGLTLNAVTLLLRELEDDEIDKEWIVG